MAASGQKPPPRFVTGAAAAPQQPDARTFAAGGNACRPTILGIGAETGHLCSAARKLLRCCYCGGRSASVSSSPIVAMFIGGGSHNSVAVEFKDFVTVIEGPLSNQRTNAVVAEVHKLFPNKPIRYLVNTHNHFDHLGGVRGFVAEGATVITDDRNRNFYQQVVLAPQQRTLQFDRLSQRPFAPTGPGTLELQTFTDHYTISDGNQIIELYHVDGLNHSDNMLIAYLPKEKIVVNADLYGPPPAGGNLANVSNNAVVLYRNLKRLKLDVSTHVPIHGNPGSNADFERIVGPVAARTPQQGDGG